VNYINTQSDCWWWTKGCSGSIWFKKETVFQCSNF